MTIIDVDQEHLNYRLLVFEKLEIKTLDINIATWI